MSNQLVKLAQEKAELRDQNEVMMKRLKKEEDELQGLEQAMALLKKSNNDYRYNYLNVICIMYLSIYKGTRGPWTAMSALIKVDEIMTKLAKKIRYRNYSKLVQFFWEKAQCVCTLVKSATKKALFSRHATAR